MKKLFLLLAGIAAVCVVEAAPQRVEFDKLPKNSQEFVQRNFAGETIKSIEMDRDSSWDKYTVYFNSGNEVSFEGGSGDCTRIVMKSGAVPMVSLPAKVKGYVGNNYPSQRITMYETTDNGYRIGLSDNRMLNFDRDGNYLNSTK